MKDPKKGIIYAGDSRIEELAQDYEKLLRAVRPVLTERMISRRIVEMRSKVGEVPVPINHTSILFGTVGSMKRAGAKIRQDKETISMKAWKNISKRAEWREQNTAVGHKADGLCVFSAVFIANKTSKKRDAAAIYWIDIDLDSKTDPLGKVLAAVLKSQEDVDDFVAWVHTWGICDAYTTASHDPEADRFHVKVHLPCEPISYLERAIIGLEIRKMIAARYGIVPVADHFDKVTGKLIPSDWKCIDPIAERGVQLQHLPRLKDVRRLGLHRAFPLLVGDVINLRNFFGRDLIAFSRDKIVATQKSKEARNESRLKAGLPSEEVEARERIESSDLSDRQRKAEKMLHKHGPAVEGHHGDDHTFQAILIGIKCGLSPEEFWPLLEDWNDDCLPPWDEGELQAYMERKYATAPSRMVGCLLPPVTSRQTVMDTLAELAGEGGLVEFERGGAGGVDQLFLLKESEKKVEPPTANDTPAPSSLEGADGAAQTAPKVPTRIKLKGGGTIPRPSKVTLLDTAVIPAKTLASLTHRLTLVDSACCTQKTRSMIPAFAEAKRKGLRAVAIVPSQSLSASMGTDLDIPSHMDDTGFMHWDKSIVTCFDSVWKIQLSVWEKPTGIAEMDLDSVAVPGVEVERPIKLVFIDELNEINDLRTGATLRAAHKCDLVQGKLEDMAKDPDTRWVVGTAHMDLEAMAFILNDVFGWTDEVTADYELVVNKAQPLKPDVFIGHDPDRMNKEIVDVLMEGTKAICFASTKLESEDIARRVAIQTMSRRLHSDVSHLCGDSGEQALDPADKLPELMAELARLGKTLADVRPSVLLVNADNMSIEAQAALKNPALMARYEFIVHTSSIRSGFNIDAERAVFARLVEGAGPVAESNHQAVLRCRRPWKNRIRICITGQAPIKSTDWKEHLRILTTRCEATAQLLDGISTFREARKDGTKYLVIHNPKLVEAEARRLARVERQAHISDRYDEMGKLVQAGAQAQFWTKLGWNVYHLHEMEEEESWSVPKEEVKAKKKSRRDSRKAIKVASNVKVSAAGGMDKETADKMRRTSRLPEVRRQVKNTTIRWRYGMEEIAPDDVAWDAKHWGHCLEFSVLSAYKIDKAKIITACADKDGPIKVCQRHAAYRADLGNRWLDAIGLGDLAAYAATGAPIPSLGEYLYVNPGELQEMNDHFDYRLWEADLVGTNFTKKFLQRYGIECRRKRFMVNGERVWKHILCPKSVAQMLEKSKASILRLLDADKAAQQWEALEKTIKSKALVKFPEADLKDLLASILDDETYTPVKVA